MTTQSSLLPPLSPLSAHLSDPPRYFLSHKEFGLFLGLGHYKPHWSRISYQGALHAVTFGDAKEALEMARLIQLEDHLTQIDACMAPIPQAKADKVRELGLDAGPWGSHDPDEDRKDIERVGGAITALMQNQAFLGAISRVSGGANPMKSPFGQSSLICAKALIAALGGSQARLIRLESIAEDKPEEPGAVEHYGVLYKGEVVDMNGVHEDPGEWDANTFWEQSFRERGASWHTRLRFGEGDSSEFPSNPEAVSTLSILVARAMAGDLPQEQAQAEAAFSPPANPFARSRQRGG